MPQIILRILDAIERDRVSRNLKSISPHELNTIKAASEAELDRVSRHKDIISSGQAIQTTSTFWSSK
jgi:hypothetical protein